MSSCKELLLDVMRLVQEVEKGLAGEEKRRRVLTLTMRVLEQLTEDSGEKQGESSKRKTTELERKGKESGGQRQEAASTVIELPQSYRRSNWKDNWRMNTGLGNRVPQHVVGRKDCLSGERCRQNRCILMVCV